MLTDSFELLHFNNNINFLPSRTHCGPVTPYGVVEVREDTDPLPEPGLSYHRWYPVALTAFLRITVTS